MEETMTTTTQCGDERPMVFGIGLSKTGTTSLSAALNLLGWKSVHYPDPELMWRGRYADALRGFNAAADISVSAFYRELDAAFPGSRFVLTVRRDVEAWLESAESHYAKLARRMAPGEQPIGARYEVRRRVYGIAGFEWERFRQAAVEHERAVRGYFAERPESLLIMDVCASEGYGALCPFLGVAEPAFGFPHENARRTAAAERVA